MRCLETASPGLGLQTVNIFYSWSPMSDNHHAQATLPTVYLPHGLPENLGRSTGNRSDIIPMNLSFHEDSLPVATRARNSIKICSVHDCGPTTCRPSGQSSLTLFIIN